jgi:hypothetical protein
VNQVASRAFGPENGNDVFLRNDGSVSTDDMGVISEKIEIFIITPVKTSDPNT